MGEPGAPRVGPTSTLESGQVVENTDLGEEAKRKKARITANRLLSTEDGFQTYLVYMMDHVRFHVNWKKLKRTIQRKSIPF